MHFLVLLLLEQLLQTQQIRVDDPELLTEEEAPDCPEARLVSAAPLVFELAHPFAVKVGWVTNHTLKASPKCQSDAPGLCAASVMPVYGPPGNVVQGSLARITAHAECIRQGHSQLFLCPVGASSNTCAAALRLPERPWRLRHWFQAVIPAARMERLDDPANRSFLQDFVLEGLFLLILLALVGVFFWLGREIWLLRSQPPAPQGPSELIIPSDLQIMKQGVRDVLHFTAGCVLLLFAAMTFLQKFGRGQAMDNLLLASPLLLGPAGTCRIFLCNSRRLLFHALLRHHVVLDFHRQGLEPLLLWLYGGFGMVVAVLLLSSWQCVRQNLISPLGMMVGLIVFSSPLQYMLFSLRNSLSLEKEVLDQTCLKKLCEASELAKLQRLAVGCFLAAARKEPRSEKPLASDIEAAKALVPAEHTRALQLSDMLWIPRLVSPKPFLVTSMPLLVFLTLFLALANIACYTDHQIEVPELTSLSADVPGLHPPFTPEVREYTFMVCEGQKSITLAAAANPDKTSHISALIISGALRETQKETSVSGTLSYYVPLRRLNATYPTIIALSVGTLSEVLEYRITVMETEPVLRSLVLRGDNYERQAHLRAELAVMRWLYGLPQEAPAASSMSVSREFVTVFRTQEEECSAWCKPQPFCYGFRPGAGGCFFVFGPKVSDDVNSCWQLQALEAPTVKDGKQVAASACNELRECQREVESEGRLVFDISRLVSNKKLSHEKLAFTVELRSGASVFSANSHELSLHRGTPWVKDLLEASNHPELIKTVVQWQRSPSGKQRVKIQVSYNPRKLGKYFVLSFREVLDDPEFGLMLGPDSRWTFDGPSIPCTQKAWRFSLCGARPTIALQLDTWRPVVHADILVKYTHDIRLFPMRPLELEVQYKDLVSGQHSVVQAATVQNCSLPTCRGKAGEHFDEGGFCPKCRHMWVRPNIRRCKTRCLKEAAEYCAQVRTSDSEVEFLAFASTSAEKSRAFTFTKLKSYIGLEATEYFRKLLTKDVILAIAANCDYHTGLLDIVADWLFSAAFTPAFREILAHAGQNPMMSSWGLQEALLSILLPTTRAHDLAKTTQVWGGPAHFFDALERVLPLSTVISTQVLRPWTYAVCQAAAPRQRRQRLTFQTMSGLLSQLDEAYDDREVQSIQTALRMIQRCVMLTRKEQQPQLEPMQCGHVLYMAHNEQVFQSLLAFCNSGQQIEIELAYTGGMTVNQTVLHVAAARDFGDTLNMIFQKRPACGKMPLFDQLPDVNAAFTAVESIGSCDLALMRSTAMHNACASGCWSCVESLALANALVSQTADVYALKVQDPDTETVLDLFDEMDEKDIAFSVVLGLRPIHLAAIRLCGGCLERLLHHGEDPEAAMELQVKTGGRCTLRPLDLAVAFHCELCVAALLNASNASEVVIDNITSITSLPLLQLLPHATRAVRCPNWSNATNSGARDVSSYDLLRLIAESNWGFRVERRSDPQSLDQ
ncbi:unnamed protein product [Effrenium voratum]|uniref:Uncharacterized protein n=1 Tax=Effrenium voratum TaxID=2562239 RepID=A0AA36JRH7_9DINO|nr:unnamed protein product [Effrenium voratum]CAJ1443490.1 unnamed protein product [Effrenium voratum]